MNIVINQSFMYFLSKIGKNPLFLASENVFSDFQTVFIDDNLNLDFQPLIRQNKTFESIFRFKILP